MVLLLAKPLNVMADPVVLTLRPNAPGDLTQLRPVGATNNWDCVDDVVPDGHTTYVINPDTTSTNTKRDLYRHSGERRSGVITSVRVYVTSHRHAWYSTWGDQVVTECYSLIKTRGTVYRGGGVTTWGSDFITGYGEWTTNPATGSAWTWDDIVALQFGCELRNTWGYSYPYSWWYQPCCTQVYAAVEYVPPEVLGAIENIRYFNPTSGIYQTTPPANIPLGSLIGCVASMRNTGTQDQRMYMKFTLKRPDGSVKSVLDLSGNQRALPPGGTHDQGWTDTADRTGTWTMMIELYGEAA